MKKRILIIGGTGFIGYHLAKYCIKKNFLITSVSTKKPIKKRNLNKVNYIFSDISNKKKLFKSLSNQKFDYVVNFGGYVDHSDSKKTYNTHFIGCKNLVNFFEKKKILKFIQMGSSLEYGNLKSPHKENATTSVRKLKSTYSKSKLLATNYLLDKFKKKKFPCIIFRLYLSYGPKQDFNRLIPIVIRQCLVGNAFSVSHGNQIRDFVYIDDLIKLIFKSLKNKTCGQIFNIGSGKLIKIKTLINKIKKNLKKGSPLFGKIKLRKDEQLNIFPDIEKTKNCFNWKANTSISNGVKKTIDYYKNENHE